MKPVCELAQCCVAPPDSDHEDLSLHKWAQVRDLTSFRKLVQRLQGQIFSVAYALLGSESEADRAAQKVFVRLYHSARPLDREQEVFEYAYRFAIEQVLVELRLRRLRNLMPWHKEPVPDRDRLSATDECRERTLALQYLAVLPAKERALLVLREVANQPVESVAKIMQMKPAAVRKRLFSARQKLLSVAPLGGEAKRRGDV